MAMNVSLTPELERYVNQKIESGLYQTASEVVRSGLAAPQGERGSAPADGGGAASRAPGQASTRPTAGSYRRWTPKAR